MTNFYLPYTATTNDENIKRLLRSIELQRELDQHYGRQVESLRYLFTDSAKPLSSDVVAFFNGGIFESHPYVQVPGGRRFNMSMLRNEAIRYGRHIGAEWTMLCDSDTVIEPKPFTEPLSRYAIPKLYYQPNYESAVASLDRISKSEDDPYAKGNSWFVLHRELLNMLLFNEDFSGYGWEDNEFHARIKGAGYAGPGGLQIEVLDHTIIHSFHPHAERRIEPPILACNEALGKSIRKLIELGIIDPRAPVPHMDVYEVIHPMWRHYLVMCPARQSVVLYYGNDRFNFATYRMSGQILTVQWPFNYPDVFRLEDGKFLEIGLYEQRRKAVLGPAH